MRDNKLSDETVEDIKEFIKALPAYSVFNISSISRELKKDKNTVSKYLFFMQYTGLLKEVVPVELGNSRLYVKKEINEFE